jgi:hypothetical protein
MALLFHPSSRKDNQNFNQVKVARLSANCSHLYGFRALSSRVYVRNQRRISRITFKMLIKSPREGTPFFATPPLVRNASAWHPHCQRSTDPQFGRGTPSSQSCSLRARSIDPDPHRALDVRRYSDYVVAASS